MTCSAKIPIGVSRPIAAAFVAALALGLHGCGPTPPHPQPVGWKLVPIEVKGSHFYNSSSKEQFHPQGIVFPNLGDVHVTVWMDVLNRIASLSAHKINTVRILELPSYATTEGSNGFQPFMKAADDLGIYVVLPGYSNSTGPKNSDNWGRFPTPLECGVPFSPQRCYEVNQILGYGRTVVANLHFPNTLAIVIADAVETNLQALPVLKAYARDLKNFMAMCNTHQDSPTKGKMRQIPLMYAAADEGPDVDFYAEGDYLFCQDPKTSVDILGLNMKRWVDDVHGRDEYRSEDDTVAARQWPGAFVHSTEGGPYNPGENCSAPTWNCSAPTWNQVPHFLHNWKAIDGFYGYEYYGHKAADKEYNMFGGPYANATELASGKVFFDKLRKIEAGDSKPPEAVTAPKCQDSITWKGNKVYLANFRKLRVYDTGTSGYPKNCPQPLKASNGVKLTKGVEVIV